MSIRDRWIHLVISALVWLMADVATATCPAELPRPDVDAYRSSTWGLNQHNTRFQAASALSTTNVDTLRLQWVYKLANDTPRSYPLVSEDTIFIGDGGRGVVALDRATGCERWVHEHTGYIASAILPFSHSSGPALLFNDRITGLHAISAADGRLLWHAKFSEEPLAWFSGTPLVVAQRVFVPIASQEVGLALNPLYGCCTTSGGMAAFDLEQGQLLWYLPTIKEAAQETGSHWLFVQKYGPSGAPVWGAPSYDAEHSTVFFGTGQNYSHPTTDTSDALFAVDAATGEVLWYRQFTANDAYTAACNWMALNHPNCPKPTGPDVDFGAPTLLAHNRRGQQLLLAGQKSGDVYAVNPRDGSTVWHQKIGRGGIIGGIHWGLAVNQTLNLVFAPISDKAILDFPAPGTASPGLYALDLDDGRLRWHYQRQSRCPETACEYGLSAAPIAANDIVVTGSMDGYLEIYRAADGKRLWHFDAWQEFAAVNGPATGGAFDAHGPMLADHQLMVTAGYSYVGAQRGGNAFLVFEATP